MRHVTQLPDESTALQAGTAQLRVIGTRHHQHARPVRSLLLTGDCQMTPLGT